MKRHLLDTDHVGEAMRENAPLLLLSRSQG
jgi:hypothetical protein